MQFSYGGFTKNMHFVHNYFVYAFLYTLLDLRNALHFWEVWFFKTMFVFQFVHCIGKSEFGSFAFKCDLDNNNNKTSPIPNGGCHFVFPIYLFFLFFVCEVQHCPGTLFWWKNWWPPQISCSPVGCNISFLSPNALERHYIGAFWGEINVGSQEWLPVSALPVSFCIQWFFLNHKLEGNEPNGPHFILLFIAN